MAKDFFDGIDWVTQMFDFDGDRQLEGFERFTAENVLILQSMDEEERREALEKAGLDPDKYLDK